MALPLSAAEIAQIHKLRTGQPYLWFLEVFVPVDPNPPGAMARYVSQRHAVAFGTDNAGDPITYQPGNFSVGKVRRDSEGIFPTLSVVASNVSRVLQSVVENHDGIVGEYARVFLVNRATIASGKPTWELEGEVVRARAKANAVTFQIGLANLVQVNFPAQQALRDYCGVRFGGLLCGYDTGRVGALQTCDKTKDGANGCTVHGDDEVSAGLERRHPRRWNAFPGMKRRGGISR